jgi:anti-sigma regulatory factor (Ser/Thr protein kinase)
MIAANHHVAASWPAEADSVAHVRRWVGDQLDAVGFGRVDDMVLIASELVTNALRHSRSGRGGHVVVALWVIAGSYVELNVREHGHDGPPVHPVARLAALTAESGRGLHIVRTLATASACSPARWCIHGPGAGGWCSWARLDWTAVAVPAPRPAESCLSASQVRRIPELIS